MQRVSVYIDGFNLYYGNLKNNPDCKWLNVHTLVKHLIADNNEITKIKFFTAKVKNNENDPDAGSRQHKYLQAIQAHIPNLEIHYGYFSRQKVPMHNANPPPKKVKVIKTEEKGSDVNLSVHMLNDAWKDEYDMAILISNDTDMAEALKLVKTQFSNKKIGILTPGNRKTTQKLRKYADFYKPIRSGVLRASQLPDTITIPGTGKILKNTYKDS